MNLSDPRRGSLGAAATTSPGGALHTRGRREKKNALYEKRRRLRDTYRGYLSEQRKTEAFGGRNADAPTLKADDIHILISHARGPRPSCGGNLLWKAAALTEA